MYQTNTRISMTHCWINVGPPITTQHGPTLILFASMMDIHGNNSARWRHHCYNHTLCVHLFSVAYIYFTLWLVVDTWPFSFRYYDLGSGTESYYLSSMGSSYTSWPNSSRDYERMAPIQDNVSDDQSDSYEHPRTWNEPPRWSNGAQGSSRRIEEPQCPQCHTNRPVGCTPPNLHCHCSLIVQPTCCYERAKDLPSNDFTLGKFTRHGSMRPGKGHSPCSMNKGHFPCSLSSLRKGDSSLTPYSALQDDWSDPYQDIQTWQMAVLKDSIPVISQDNIELLRKEQFRPIPPWQMYYPPTPPRSKDLLPAAFITIPEPPSQKPPPPPSFPPRVPRSEIYRSQGTKKKVRFSNTGDEILGEAGGDLTPREEEHAQNTVPCQEHAQNTVHCQLVIRVM